MDDLDLPLTSAERFEMAFDKRKAKLSVDDLSDAIGNADASLRCECVMSYKDIDYLRLGLVMADILDDYVKALVKANS